MKIYAEHENGARVEKKEIESVDKASDILLLKTNARLGAEQIEAIEERMTEKIGKKCVVLDSLFDKALGI